MPPTQRNWKWASYATIVFSLALIPFAFYWYFETELICSRASDEGLWLFPSSDVESTLLYGSLTNAIRCILVDLGLPAQRFIALAFALAALALLYLILGFRENKRHELSFDSRLLFCAVIWAHPQVLKCGARATGDSIALFCTALAVYSSIRLWRISSRWNLVLWLTALFMISNSSVYGWSIGLGLVLALAILKFKLSQLALGILFSQSSWIFESFNRIQSFLQGNYFSWWFAPNWFSFGSPLVASILPTESPEGVFVLYANPVIWLWIVLTIVRNNESTSTKVLGIGLICSVLFQLLLELMLKQPTLHAYRLTPYVFLFFAILGCAIKSSRGLKWLSYLILACLVINIDTAKQTQQRALVKCAQIVNKSADNDQQVIFSGSLLYFSVYPWLDENARESSFVCTSGKGFYDDVFADSRLLGRLQTVASDHLIDSDWIQITNVSSKHGQGIHLEIPESWSMETRSFLYQDPQIEIIYVTAAKRKQK